MIYLGETGITSTSANYLANVAKEELKSAATALASISFVNEEVSLISSQETRILRNGWNTTEAIESLLNKIANLNSFCAWIREAIKEKEQLLENIEELSMDEYATIKGIEIPKAPNNPQTITSEMLIKEMSVKERNNYLRLEAFASTYGKYLHPGGSISDARDDALAKEQNPTKVQGMGRDMVIYDYSLSISRDNLNNSFMSLQDKYRDYERELNSIKYQLKDEANKRNTANIQKFKVEYQKYSAEMEILRKDMAEYINSGRESAAKLKIVIPDKLQDTYKYLDSLGKKK